jgi:hypothetical protein
VSLFSSIRSVPGSARLTDGFERMPVEIDHEGGIVGWPVMWSKTRTPVIGSASSQCCGMEGIHRSVRGCIKGQVKTGTGRPQRRWLLLERQQVSASEITVADGVRARPYPCQAERGERGVVERDSAFPVRDP